MRVLSEFKALSANRTLLPLAAMVVSCAVGVSIWVVAKAGRDTTLLLALALGALLVLGTLALVMSAVRQVVHSEEARQLAEMANHCMLESIEALPFGIAIYDEHDRLMTYNRMAAEQSPYSDGGDLLGQTYETLIRRALAREQIPDALGREEEWLRERLAGRGKLSKPLLRPRSDGSWMHYYEISTPSGCLVMTRLDVTELVQKSLALERSNKQLEQLSATDALTGLANRRMFDQHLYGEWQRSMRSRQPLSLLMIDIDHFKRYNDHYGHLAGDACLRQVASILYDCAQRSGEVVARYGGEEFALLLPGADSGAARMMAQRCMDEIGRAGIAHADSPVSDRLTLSIGVATVVANKELMPESLVRCADEALYQVKNQGRGQIQVAPCPV